MSMSIIKTSSNRPTIMRFRSIFTSFFIQNISILTLAAERRNESFSLRQSRHVHNKPSNLLISNARRSCTTCQFPKHSWDTFPVSFHSGRPNTHGPTGLEWLPEDLEALARYPLVTIEKWHGSQAFSTDICQNTGDCQTPSNVFYWEQDAWISAAKQLKAKNSNISIAVW
jgi:hypothetical protein